MNRKVTNDVWRVTGSVTHHASRITRALSGSGGPLACRRAGRPALRNNVEICGDAVTSGVAGIDQASFRAARRAPYTSGGTPDATGFSLIEIMVVMGLLSVIIIGLMSMFGQVQKAFLGSMTQTDVLESGRATAELLARELGGIAPSYRANVTNFYSDIPAIANTSVQSMPGVGGDSRTNALERLYFLTRENQNWIGIGYVVDVQNGVGTLYRYVTTTNVSRSPDTFCDDFLNTPMNSASLHRVIDGVINFSVRAYDTNGIYLISKFQSRDNFTNEFSTFAPGEAKFYIFKDNAVPAYVEFELGILENRAYQRFKALPPGTPGNSPQLNYLQNQVGKIHLFRQRVPVRMVDVTAYQ